MSYFCGNIKSIDVIMEFTITNNQSKKSFITLFQKIKLFNDCTSIFIRKGGIYIQGMDSENVSIYEVNFEREMFDTYNVQEDVVIGVNLNIFAKILGVHKTNQCIEIKMLDEDSLMISYTGVDSEFDKIFHTPLVNLDQELLNITDMEYDLEFTMEGDKMKSMIDELSQFGNTLRILYEKNSEKIIFEVNDEVYGNVRAIVGLDDLIECEVSDDENIDCLFNIKKIKQMIEREEIKCKMGESVPLKLEMKGIKSYVAPMQGA